MGPGWWRASDGKWYPPQPQMQPQPIYVPQKDPLQRAAYWSAVGCFAAVAVPLLIFLGLFFLGLAFGDDPR